MGAQSLNKEAEEKQRSQHQHSRVGDSRGNYILRPFGQTLDLTEQALTHLIFHHAKIKTYHLHFTDDETEARKSALAPVNR